MLICVTSRRLCRDDFFQRLEQIAAAGADAVLLREKDLSEPEYADMAIRCRTICEKYGATLLLNTFVQTAIQLHLPIQLPVQTLLELPDAIWEQLPAVGASVHSREEAVQAQAHGADWLITGHIFSTACKPDLPPRGLTFLRDICQSVTIPVYAIGGITADKQSAVRQAGAAGCCVMSEWMQCESPGDAISVWKQNL
ncbi:MAG: thiamine phosphate synthase [Ruminococcus sp.]